MLLAQSDVFALSDEELGETDLVSHIIDTGDAKPVKTLPRRLPYALRAELEEEMRKLMDIGCIEPSSSSYASPLVLVRKKNGGLRVCVDYRNVNKGTIPDRYPMPRIDELVDMVGRQQPTVFSSLDLMRTPSKNGGGFQTQDSVHLSSRTVPVSEDAIRADKRPGNLSAVDVTVVFRSTVELCVCIS